MDGSFEPAVSVASVSGGVVSIEGVQRTAHGIPSLRPVDSGESEVQLLPGWGRDQVLLFQPRHGH